MLYPLRAEWTRGAATAVVALLLGCGGNATVPGSTDPEGDASAADENDASAADASPPLPPCENPLSGDGPFGMQLAGLTYPEGHPHAAAFAIFFPEGRRAGRVAYFVDDWDGADVEYQALMVADRFTIDEDLGADVVIDWDRKYSDLRIKGRLIGPSDGIDANFSNINRGGMEPYDEAWQDKLCPVSDAREIRLVSNSYYGPYGPNSTVTFSASGPIDAATVSAQVTSAGLPVQVDTEFVDLGRAIRLSPRPGQAFPPNEPIDVDWSGTKDVLGRDVVPYNGTGVYGTGPVGTGPLVTTNVVSDPTFGTDPPLGSIAVSWWEFEREFTQTDGAINLAPIGVFDPYTWYFYTWLTALVALPDPGTATHVRLKASTSGACSVRFTVTDAAGTAADIATTDYDPATIDESVAIPGTGPLWLSAYAERTISYAAAPPKWCEILVDEVAFE